MSNQYRDQLSKHTAGEVGKLVKAAYAETMEGHGGSTAHYAEWLASFFPMPNANEMATLHVAHQAGKTDK